MGTYSPASDRTHLLTLQEAVAEGFGAYSTLRSWIAQGKLPAVKTGKSFKILREDLEALTVPVGGDPVERQVERLIEAAPHLSSDQVARLRAALFGGGQR